MKWTRTAAYGALCGIYGSVLFWLPDTLWHLLRRDSFSVIDLMVLTAVPPPIVGVGWWLLMRRPGTQISRMFGSAAMVLGILITCPLVTMVNRTFAGAGFASGLTWRQLGILTLLFPLSDIDCFTYDGSLFAIGSCLVGLIFVPFMIPMFYKDTCGIEPGHGSPHIAGSPQDNAG